MRVRRSWGSERPRAVLEQAISTLILAVFVFGYNPYVFNQSNFGFFFYPVTSYPLSGVTPKEESLIRDQLPADFVEANRLEKFARSLFGESANPFRPSTSIQKWPWQISASEFLSFKDPDVRVGGLGPWFALSLFLSIGILLSLFWREGRNVSTLLFCCVVIAASILLNPEAWWARYVPQLWLLPLLTVAVCLSRRVLRYPAYLLLLVLCVNAGGIAYSSISHQVQASELLRAQLDSLAEGPPIAVTFSQFRSNRFRFQQFSIPFVEVESLQCSAPQALLYSQARYCSAETVHDG